MCNYLLPRLICMKLQLSAEVTFHKNLNWNKRLDNKINKTTINFWYVVSYNYSPLVQTTVITDLWKHSKTPHTKILYNIVKVEPLLKATVDPNE